MNYKNYSLFVDVEDQELRTYNRARILKNMMEDFSNKDRVVSPTGQELLIGYMQAIPEAERKQVHTKLVELLKEKKKVI